MDDAGAGPRPSAEGPLDRAFRFDAELRTSLRAVAGVLLEEFVEHSLTPPSRSIAEVAERAAAGVVDSEPSTITDARFHAAMIALAIAEPAHAFDNNAIPRASRDVRKLMRFFGEAHVGADTHVALAAARIVTARCRPQFHDAVRMLALLPPRYELRLLEDYGLAARACDSTWCRPDRAALWQPIGEATILNHGAPYGRMTRPADWGARARAEVDTMYMDLVEGDVYCHLEPEAEDLSSDAPAAAPGTAEEDVVRTALEHDVELVRALDRRRKKMLERTAKIARAPAAPGADEGAMYGTTMDWINMLAMQHVLSEGLVPNHAPWAAIRDAMRTLFAHLHWHLDQPKLPPGVKGLCVMLQTESATDFHDGARMFAGLAMWYHAPVPKGEITVEDERTTLRMLLLPAVGTARPKDGELVPKGRTRSDPLRGSSERDELAWQKK